MNVRYLAILVAGLLLGIGSVNLSAHEGGHHDDSPVSSASRTWSVAADGTHLHGTFVCVIDGDVQIRRGDGKLTRIAINRLVASDQAWIEARQEEIQLLNRHRDMRLVMLNQPSDTDHRNTTDTKSMPAIGEHFKPFERMLQLRWDDDFFYVGSNGLPEHPMMIGIRAWQQQVPIPQKYLGDNAWRIPLHPVPAKNPMSTKNDFLRGAIALAVNGVPVFNPLNNRGDDAFLFGELDQYGGHCGRADDYHYHIAPVHLEETTGDGNPIAYALDGYPIFGYQDQKAADFAPLDSLGGHKDASGNYHYHAQKTYPYLNGGFYGEVTKRDGQVDPQPRAEPLRPALRPLRDAKITGFNRTGNQFQLVYDVSGRKGRIDYVVKENGSVDFTFQDPSGNTRTESYQSRMGKPYLPQRDASETDVDLSHHSPSGMPMLTVTSPAFVAGSEMPIEFTGDGVGQSPPLAWTKGPEGTQCYALNLWHTPGPGDIKSYWLLYDIPADVTRLPANARGIGTAGYNDKGHATYDPMRSKGPGVKEYHITVYALSENPDFASTKVTRDELLKSIADITLAQGTLDYQYTRTRTRSWMMIAGLILAGIVAIAMWFRKRRPTPSVGLPLVQT
ncbi:YHYH protein [Novipirellula caenicola]|uniref:YHYH domain-containing protein n=1 Tax=Novipirellula caenicola TaxID=1536901 RepID=A0ABP9VZL9_9BACT